MNHLLLSLLSSQGSAPQTALSPHPQTPQALPSPEKPFSPIFSGLLADIQGKSDAPRVSTLSYSDSQLSFEAPIHLKESEVSASLYRELNSPAVRQDLPQLRNVPLSHDLPPDEERIPITQSIPQEALTGKESSSFPKAPPVPFQGPLGFLSDFATTRKESHYPIRRVTSLPLHQVGTPVSENPSTESRGIPIPINDVSRDEGQGPEGVPIRPIAVSTELTPAHSQAFPVLRGESQSREPAVHNGRSSSNVEVPSVPSGPIAGSRKQHSTEVAPQVQASDPSTGKPASLPGNSPLTPQPIVTKVQEPFHNSQRPVSSPVIPPSVPPTAPGPLAEALPSSISSTRLQGHPSFFNGAMNQAHESIPQVSAIESTTNVSGEQGKGSLDFMFKGSSGEFGNGQDLAHGFGSAPQSQMPAQHHAATALSHNLSVRSGEERFPEMPGATLQRLQMDVQLSENSRVQVEVGVQQRQVYAGMIMDQAALKNLAVQFVPQLENQLTQVNLELQEFSAEVRDQRESGKNEGSHGPEDLAYSGGKTGNAEQEPSDPKSNTVPELNETGLHFVA